MSAEVTPGELTLYDEITQLAGALWKTSLGIEGLNTDPKMFSIMLFKRLWSNHRGYTLLWNNELHLEGDIILRSGIEASICIAANFRLRDGFVALMRDDAIFTLRNQMKLHQEQDAREGTAADPVLRDLAAVLPVRGKPLKLNWKTLAAEGRVPQLYDWFRMLSGLSSHVTGVSVLTGVVSDGMTPEHAELRVLTQKTHLMMMAGATLLGSMHHAAMIGDEPKFQEALSLISRMNAVSELWLGGISDG